MTSTVKVISAESGSSVTLSTASDLQALGAAIEGAWDIPAKDQILLTTSGHQLPVSGLAPNSAESVIVFDKRVLELGHPLQPLEFPVEPEWKRRAPAIAPSLPKELLAAFQEHAQYGQSLLKMAKNHCATAGKLYGEQKNQSDALQTALSNLKSHSTPVCDTFDAFYSQAQREMGKHATLLKNFAMDMETLHHIPIHPAISEKKNLFLADLVPLDKLQSWAMNCREAHDSLVENVMEVTEDIKFIKAGTQKEENEHLKADLQGISQSVNQIRDALANMEQRQSILTRDVQKVESLVNEIQRQPSSPNSAQRLNAMEHLFEIHQKEYIPEMAGLDRCIRDSLVSIGNSKVSQTHQLVGKLVAIARIQSVIASVNPKLYQLSSSLALHIQAFSQLLHVHRMAPAWGAALIEIVRRKEYSRVFLSKAREMAEILARFRLLEEKRRENFKTEIVQYLPPGLISGLDDKPPLSDITISNAQDTLPLITTTDIMEFEKLVANVRQSLLERWKGPQSNAPPTDSISKLQATIVKMASHVSGIGADFDRILFKSGLSDKLPRVEEESPTLRKEDGSGRYGEPRSSGSLTSSFYRQQSLEDTNKAYEDRIKSLEKALQGAYSRSASGSYTAGDSSEIMKLRKQVAEYASQSEKDIAKIRELQQEREQKTATLTNATESLELAQKKYSQLDTDHEMLSRETENLKKELEAAKGLAAKRDGELTDLRTEKSRLDEFILELYIEYSSASNPSERPLSSSQISIDNVTPHLDSIRKWIRELHDELLCTRAEIANEADPQTALSKLSYTTEDIDDLVQQLEEATGRFQLAENQLEENGRARQTKDEELHKVQAALDTLRVELAQVQSNEKAVVEEDKTHIAFQNFAVEDLILFLPTRNPIAWAAFNVNAPHYFLSIQEHRNFQSQIRKREWILATLTEVDSRIVDDQDENKFGLAMGAQYHICSVSAWNS